MKWRINMLRRAIGTLLYETTGEMPCCGEEIAKLQSELDVHKFVYVTLRVCKDCDYVKTGLVEVHDWKVEGAEE